VNFKKPKVFVTKNKVDEPLQITALRNGTSKHGKIRKILPGSSSNCQSMIKRP